MMGSADWIALVHTANIFLADTEIGLSRCIVTVFGNSRRIYTYTLSHIFDFLQNYRMFTVIAYFPTLLSTHTDVCRPTLDVRTEHYVPTGG